MKFGQVTVILMTAMFWFANVAEAQGTFGQSFKVAAQGSCATEYARCADRCHSNTAGDKPDVCRRKHCDSKMAGCRQSGCWQQDARFGGAVTCGLAK